MLSHYEQRQLRRIEQWFETTEPKLADVLRRCEPARPEPKPGRTEPSRTESRSTECRLTESRIAVGVAWTLAYVLGGTLVFVGLLWLNFFLIFFGVTTIVGAGTAQLTQFSELRRKRSE